MTLQKKILNRGRVIFTELMQTAKTAEKIEREKNPVYTILRKHETKVHVRRTNKNLLYRELNHQYNPYFFPYTDHFNISYEEHETRNKK